MATVTAEKAKTYSASTFLTAFAVNGGLLLLEVGAFLIAKQKLTRIYTPRTYLPPPDKRAAELPTGPFRWLPAVIRSPATDIIHKNGLDAFMFLRFLKMLIVIFAVFTISTFAVLFPTTAAGIDTPENPGLDRLQWTNISDGKDKNRYAAHIILVYLLTFFVLYLIRREMLIFVHHRHQFLISKDHSNLPQARTVLITSVPDELATEKNLRQFASFVPGGVDRVWILRETKALNELFERRADACSKLETAITVVLKKASKAWGARQMAHEKEQKRLKKAKVQDVEKIAVEAPMLPLEISHEFLNELVPLKQRPTHRTGLVGCVGDKVDSIDWCTQEIGTLNKDIKEMRAHLVKGKFLGSAFIRCNLQMGAHVLAQCVSYHEPLKMYDKWIEANPKDIVWRNLDDGAFETRGRYVISWILTVGLIVLWSFPATFIGTLSNVDELCNYEWLAWVCDSSDIVTGLITGVLPPALMAIMFAILPLILRALAWYECIPRWSLISVSVYRRFFLFLMIHGFLIVTLASGLIKSLEDLINEPTKTVQILASNLPGSYIFFLTYMVTQGFTGAASALIQLVPLILHYIRKWFLGRTPRQAYAVTFLMPAADFGTILPRMSLLATIAFAYSIISPLINLLACVGFTLMFIAWKFLLMQVFDQPDEAETGGIYFPMAIGNLFVGLYIEQICLACLFFLKVADSGTTFLAQGFLMIALVVITAGSHILLNKSFNPIVNYLPMSMATAKMAKRYERRRARRERERAEMKDQVEEELDLFSRAQVKNLKVVRRRIKAFPKKMLAKVKEKTKGSKEEEHSDSSDDDEDEKDRVKASGVSTSRTPVNGDGPPRLPELERATSKDSKMSRKSLREEENKQQEPFPPVISETAAAKSADVSPSPGELVRQPSNSSHKSKRSHKSTKKDEQDPTAPPPAPESEHEDDVPKFAAPAPAGVDLSDESDDGEGGEEEEEDEHAFDHPSAYVEQPWIWVPKDTIGLSGVFIADLRAAGVDASDEGAAIDESGVVEVERNPPDESWSGGHDR